jgi:MinD-like ATPase involved in chromosome partitioning or flagellar assembly
MKAAASASRLGLFGFEDRNLSSIAVAGAEWMARHSQEPVLLVEADWRRSSGVAGLLQLGRRGLGEALNDPDARMESLIQEGVRPNLAVLASGAAPSAKGSRLAEKIGTLLTTLRRRYPAVFLVMPPTFSPDWSSYAAAGLADVGLLAIRPQSTSRRRAELGMSSIRQTGFPVAACLLDIGASAQNSLRLSQIAQPASPSARDGEL